MKLLDGVGNIMKETKQTQNKTKRIVISMLGILLLLCSVFAIGLAIFVFEDMSNHENSITTGTVEDTTISFSYNEESNGIELVNAIPLEDRVGKKLTNSNKAQGINQGYFDFTIRAKGSMQEKIYYEIYATIEDDSDMDPNYIKVYLTDDNDVPYDAYDTSVPVFAKLNDSKEADNAKVLFSDEIVGNEEVVKKFRLRLWVAHDYSDGTTSKNFKIKVNVKATA